MKHLLDNTKINERKYLGPYRSKYSSAPFKRNKNIFNHSVDESYIKKSHRIRPMR